MAFFSEDCSDDPRIPDSPVIVEAFPSREHVRKMLCRDVIVAVCLTLFFCGLLVCVSIAVPDQFPQKVHIIGVCALFSCGGIFGLLTIHLPRWLRYKKGNQVVDGFQIIGDNLYIHHKLGGHCLIIPVSSIISVSNDKFRFKFCYMDAQGKKRVTRGFEKKNLDKEKIEKLISFFGDKAFLPFYV